MDDADLDLAVNVALGGAFGGTQDKNAQRLRVWWFTPQCMMHLSKKLVAGAKAMQVGHALEAGTQMGPVVSEQQLRENLAYAELGRAEGAELACGGERLNMKHEGFLYVARSIRKHTRIPCASIARKMFAPLTSVIKVDSYDEAPFGGE